MVTRLRLEENSSSSDWEIIKTKILDFIKDTSRKSFVVASDKHGYTWDDIEYIFDRILDDEDIENELIYAKVIGKLHYAHNRYAQAMPKLTMEKSPSKRRFGWSDWTKPNK